VTGALQLFYIDSHLKAYMKPNSWDRLFLILISLITLLSKSNAQANSIKVLFLGNSYTQYNNLPLLLSNIALSSGDTVQTDANTPGGHTFMGHSTNSVSLGKINSQKWDYVVLQEQSQLPSFPDADVQEMVFPYSRALDSLIKANNTCTKTVFYMTWGRKNGDAQNCPTWPPVCTYRGMDSLLALRYRKMADDNQALLSPVGAVWKYLRANNPSIELYNADESHPSLAGSYAAACTFYTLLLKKDPTLITYNGGLTTNQALAIREAAKVIVYQKLSDWNVGEFGPKAGFKHQTSNPKTIQFQNTSTNADGYLWEFGDGDTSTLFEPLHTYKTNGNFKVNLIANRCNETDRTWTEVSINTTGINQLSSQKVQVFPNPANGFIQLEIPENMIGLEYQIIDIYGKKLLTGLLQNSQAQISLETLPAGLYSLQLGSVCQKFVKQ